MSTIAKNEFVNKLKNLRYPLFFLGRILRIVSAIFLFPTIIAIIYKEYFNIAAFLPVGAGTFIIGWLLSFKTPEDVKISVKASYSMVAIVWLVMVLLIAISYQITGEYSNFADCIFESASGFSTTGATIFRDVESLSKSVNAMRLFSHWVGGMGILVLVIAVIPNTKGESSINIFKAEVPGHQVDKFTNKLTKSAKILYIIYLALTIILAVSFIIAKMPIYDSIVHAMSIAGTGGFSIKNASIAAYQSTAISTIATVGMYVFGINLYCVYLICIGKVLNVLFSEELRVYITICVVTMLTIATTLYARGLYSTFGSALLDSSFETAAFISTTGMGIADYQSWPVFCQAILFLLMLTGGCSGSTAGGLKLSRIIIASKYAWREILTLSKPNRVRVVKLENKPLDNKVVNGTMSYIVFYAGIVIVGFILVSIIETIANTPKQGFLENFTIIVSCMSNVGPHFGTVDSGLCTDYSIISKILLSLIMIAGRLEILPMVYLFTPRNV